ncbi:MAG: hypothetical protein KAI89_06735 [Emcibacter sp.]|nr:hypothetical protein [Emcibacter sp.]
MTSLTQPSTTQVVDKLVAEDIITCVPRKNDNRIMKFF